MAKQRTVWDEQVEGFLEAYEKTFVSMTDEWGQLSPRVSNATKAVMMESILNGGGTMTIDEVLEACDKHRESQEGVGLSDELIRIVTFAYEQGCGARAVGSLKDLI